MLNSILTQELWHWQKLARWNHTIFQSLLTDNPWRMSLVPATVNIRLITSPRCSWESGWKVFIPALSIRAENLVLESEWRKCSLEFYWFWWCRELSRADRVSPAYNYHQLLCIMKLTQSPAQTAYHDYRVECNVKPDEDDKFRTNDINDTECCHNDRGVPYDDN